MPSQIVLVPHGGALKEKALAGKGVCAKIKLTVDQREQT